MNGDIEKAEDLVFPNCRDEAMIETLISLLKGKVKAAKGVPVQRLVQQPKNVRGEAKVKNLENTARSSE